MNEGYLKYFGVLFCLFAVASLIPPVSAGMSYGSLNGSLATTGDIWIKNYNYTPTQSQADICTMYGKTASAYYGAGSLFTFYSAVPANSYTYSTAVGWDFVTDIHTYPANATPHDNTPTSVSAGDWTYCEPGTLPYIGMNHAYYNSTAYAPQLSVNFTGAPLSGTVPLTVSFTDTSSNVTGGETWNWSVSPAPGVSINTPAAQSTSMTFATVGNYTITHGGSNNIYSDIETKTDYIFVYNSTATTTTYFYTYNALSGYEIHNSNIYLKDIENSSWVNSTSDPDGRLGITTLGGHHINAYGEATGFGDADILNQISDGGSYPLIMFSTNVTNVSAGSVTLYVSVVDTWSPGTPVSGATVNLAYDTPGGQFNDYAITNSGGLASFTVPNQTLIYVYAEKAGYTPGGSTVNSGTGSGGSASVSTIVYITQTEVTPTVTATTGTGGTVPRTVDPYPCIGDGSYQDNINCQRKQTEMGADVIAWAPTLIQLFILATIIGTLKIMTK